MTLTDEDRAEIERVLAQGGYGGFEPMPTQIALFWAGKRAGDAEGYRRGVEAAAKACERDGGDNSDYFAAAIRTLLTADPPAPE